MQFTQYFHSTRLRQDRESIKMDWIEYVVSHPTKEFIQEDGRVRRGASIKEAEGGIYVLFYSKMVKPFITHFLIGHLNYEN